MIKYDNSYKFECLKGKTIANIVVCKGDPEKDDYILFIVSNDEMYILYHDQNCCESVSIEDICGDFNDIIENEILLAECVTSEDVDFKGDDESCLWTFYKLSTIKGSVTVRWYGSSNGYYSEKVDFSRIVKVDE